MKVEFYDCVQLDPGTLTERFLELYSRLDVLFRFRFFGEVRHIFVPEQLPLDKFHLILKNLRHEEACGAFVCIHFGHKEVYYTQMLDEDLCQDNSGISDF